ncbi:MAG: hypothetical protein WCE56_17140 [Desulfobacterales bacterium]
MPATPQMARTRNRLRATGKPRHRKDIAHFILGSPGECVGQQVHLAVLGLAVRYMAFTCGGLGKAAL